MDGVFGLRGVVADRAAGAELADPHVTVTARKDLERDPIAIVANDVLISLVSRAG